MGADLRSKEIIGLCLIALVRGAGCFTRIRYTTHPLRRKDEFFPTFLSGKPDQILDFLRRRAFRITETEEILIAAPAIIGLRKIPKKG